MRARHISKKASFLVAQEGETARQALAREFDRGDDLPEGYGTPHDCNITIDQTKWWGVDPYTDILQVCREVVFGSDKEFKGLKDPRFAEADDLCLAISRRSL